MNLELDLFYIHLKWKMAMLAIFYFEKMQSCGGKWVVLTHELLQTPRTPTNSNELPAFTKTRIPKNNSERGASEAAAGRFASVAAKLVKTATQIPIYICVKKNHTLR